MDHIECIVIGAGCVGLAIARALALAGREVLVVESESRAGTGVSSRNSGVIHAGIYYPKDSVRARLCVAGKHALYDFCESHGVTHSRIGKVIVATEDSQLDALAALRIKAADNGVDDLVPLDTAELRELEPNVSGAGALLSPSTGIIDPHDYMLALEGDIEDAGGVIALASPCLGAEVSDAGLRVDVGGDAPMSLMTDVLVNAAGLGAQQVAGNIRGLGAQHIPPLYYAKGNYFSLTGRAPFTRLVYPMPDDAWLGVHSSPDLGGRCRFGPDIHWIDTLDYEIDDRQLGSFYDAIRRYWPGLPDGALNPDYTGIRPKLYRQGEPARDFYLQMPAEHGIDGLVNLYGIESPGLTASLAIAQEVRDVV